MKVLILTSNETHYNILKQKIEGYPVEDFIPDPKVIEELLSVSAEYTVVYSNDSEKWANNLIDKFKEKSADFVKFRGTVSRLINDIEVVSKQREMRNQFLEMTKVSEEVSAVEPLVESHIDPPRKVKTTAYRFKKSCYVIAVGGANARSGCTYTAVRLAKYLQSQGFSVLCSEYLSTKKKSCVETLNLDAEREIGIFSSSGVDFAICYNKEDVLSSMAKDYDFLVLDLGEIFSSGEDLSEACTQYIMADFQVFTMGGSDWDFRQFAFTLDGLNNFGWQKGWNVVVNLADQEQFNEICDTFTKDDKKRNKLRFFNHELVSNPLKLTKGISSVMGELVQDILPTKKKSLFNFRR